ncbi:MAG: ORF6N domain-containing protein [Paludibacteraceae bacterium]|nr:ORF6N domain-containing protein [Paludibacteraceae bacterium]
MNIAQRCVAISSKSIRKYRKLISNFKGKQVMFDRDMARLYGVETKRLNERL